MNFGACAKNMGWISTSGMCGISPCRTPSGFMIPSGGHVSQGALRDPGLWSFTPSGYRTESSFFPRPLIQIRDRIAVGGIDQPAQDLLIQAARQPPRLAVPEHRQHDLVGT